MKHIHGQFEYQTTWFEDNAAGCAGIDLAVTRDNVTKPVGRITFWDAQGQFFLILDTECPVTIVEALIAEARERISST
jgi:hypothetical protein